MSKRDLQKDIRNGEGFVLSDGTLNVYHLLAKAHDLMVSYNLRTKTALGDVRADVYHFFSFDRSFDHKVGYDLWSYLYHGWARPYENPAGVGYNAWDLWNDIESFLQQLAPKGYYFGSTEGDGACIGFFQYGEEI